MSIELVNGYVCKTCSDVSLAKKGVNPAHPQDDPSSPNYNPAIAKADKAKETGAATPAVVFGGALAGLNASSAAQDSSSTASAPDSSRSVTPPANPTSSAPSYSSATSSPSQTGNPYRPGNLLNVSA